MILLKRLIGFCMPKDANHARRLILNYHSIGANEWSIPTERFKSHLEMMQSLGELCSLPELLDEPSESASIRVAISFDDGYQNLLTDALPLLDAHNASATVFVIAGEIDSGSSRLSTPSKGHYPGETFLSFDDLKTLKHSGWEIGSHGMKHENLTRLSTEGLKSEFEASKQTLEEAFGAPCRYFAYPWGAHNPSVQERCRAADYTAAFSCRHAPLSASMDKFAIPRIDVRKHYTAGDIRSILTGKWDYIGSMQKLRGTQK